MAIEVVVPPLGESVTEATVATWTKKAGDAVEVDELIVELETDKVTLEVNAPASGVLGSISANEGDTVEVGAVLGTVDEGGSGASKSEDDSKKEEKSEDKPKAEEKKAESESESESEPVETKAAPSNDSHAGVASPAASKIAAEKGVSPANIAGTGRDGRVTKGDAMSAQAGGSSSSSAVPAAPQVIRDNTVREERVKMTRLRKTIAKRLKDSQNTAAILSTFNEVDVSEIFRIRKAYQEKFIEKHGCKLGFMSFFVKAVVHALKEVPSVNAEIDGDDLIYKNYYDIGIAVGTDQGLVVPVLRDANQLSFAGIEQGIAGLGKKARDGKLSMSDMAGATFSITNGGVYGSLLSTPIINPPQSGILGMHNIVQRPVAINGNVEVRPMMYIALSYDHRIIDGKEAVTFLVKIKEVIENPEKLLFEL